MPRYNSQMMAVVRWQNVMKRGIAHITIYMMLTMNGKQHRQMEFDAKWCITASSAALCHLVAHHRMLQKGAVRRRRTVLCDEAKVRAIQCCAEQRHSLQDCEA